MTTSDRRFALALAGVLLLSTTAGPALAQPAAPAGGGAAAAAEGADPQVPFDEGRALMKAERFAEALQKFEQSLAIRQTSGALLNAGDCHEKLGRYASAVAAFDRAKELSEKAHDAARAAEATQRAAPLRGSLSTITILPSIPGATATIDRADAPIGGKVPVDGGEHVVVVSAPCHRAFETRVNVGLRGDMKDVTATMVKSEEPGCGGGVSASAGTEGFLGKNQRTIAIVAGALGAVGLGVGAVTGLSASGKQGDLEAACTDYPRGCPAARRSELDGIASDADGMATISTIGFVAGAVLVAGAVVLWVTGGRATTGQALGPARAAAAGFRF